MAERMLQSLGRPDLLLAGIASLLAGLVVAAIVATAPFAHGTWLVAYLVLVGFLAQVLLGVGQARLVSDPSSVPPLSVRIAQAGLWNLGVLAVPAGVLAETRLLVIAGSVSLTAALISFWWSVRPLHGPGQVTWLSRGYMALLAGMMASVLIGTALAWDLPWT